MKNFFKKFIPLFLIGLLISPAYTFGAALLPQQGGTGTSTTPAKGSLLVGQTTNNYGVLAVGSNGQCLVASSTAPLGAVWSSCAPGGSGITNLNGQVGVTQTFSTSSGGASGFDITSAADVHTLRIATSSATRMGLLTAADYIRFDAAVTSSSFIGPLITSSSFIGPLIASSSLIGPLVASSSLAHVAASYTGENYLSMVASTQVITGGTINDTNLTAEDFGDFTCDSNEDGCLIDANSVALSTDTTGNYVLDVADGTGIDGTASGEGATYTPTLDLTEVATSTWGAGADFTWTFDTVNPNSVISFIGGLITMTTTTIPTLNLTSLVIGGDTLTELCGTGITCSSNTLAASLGVAIDTSEITDDTIIEPDLNVDTAAVDGDILTYDSTGTNFDWVTCAELTGSADLCDGNDASGGGGGSVSTSSAITVGHIPTWTSVGGGLSGTSTATIFGGTLNNSGTIAQSGVPVALSNITITGTGFLTGGGDLTSNRTITWSAGAITSSTLWDAAYASSSQIFASSTWFKVANNLSESTNTSTLRTNIGFSAGTGLSLSSLGVFTNIGVQSLMSATGSVSFATSGVLISDITRSGQTITFTTIPTSTILDGYATSTGFTAQGTTIRTTNLTIATSGQLISATVSGNTLTLTSLSTSTILSGYSTSTGANPSASLGLTANNGTANTFMRSDGSPALSQSITPVMTGLWQFSGAGVSSTQSWLASTTLRDFTNALALVSSTGKIIAYGGSACGGSDQVTSISATGTVICSAAGSGGSGSVSTSSAITAGYFPYWNAATGALTGTSTIFQSLPNVGIGTIQPSSTLHIIGTNNPTSTFRVSSVAGATIFDVNTTSTNTSFFEIQTSSSVLLFGVSSTTTQFSTARLSSSSTVPTVSSCGSSPTIVGTNSAGYVNVGTGVVASCTLTFATPYKAKPACVVNNEVAMAVFAVPSATTLVISGTAIDADIIHYICVGIREY